LRLHERRHRRQPRQRQWRQDLQLIRLLLLLWECHRLWLNHVMPQVLPRRILVILLLLLLLLLMLLLLLSCQLRLIREVLRQLLRLWLRWDLLRRKMFMSTLVDPTSPLCLVWCNLPEHMWLTKGWFLLLSLPLALGHLRWQSMTFWGQRRTLISPLWSFLLHTCRGHDHFRWRR